MMPLKLAPADEDLTIQRIAGNEITKKHLADLGFVVGATVKVITEANGNLIVNIKESRVAIGASMAMKIFV